ncbi:uncharacterized protein BJX67DRAFT_107816 [Aspergillus lucknowensis]|uniref:Altered inheritance of mitochondria protein 41 n=1 Tax=Aspergillus lucknowensis TaxID=176173 RepID=A0ABR4LRQ5_9EURO
MFRALRQTTRLGLHQARWNSTAGPTLPPMMATLRTDLKTAMRAKDTERLDVLRALISETNNSQKTSSPINTDLKLLSLINKRVSASRDAAQQFLEAGRTDLKEKEDRAQAILQEYGGQVETMSPDEIEHIVAQEITKLKEAGKQVQIGIVLKALLGSGGALSGKPAEPSKVTEIIKNSLSS